MIPSLPTLRYIPLLALLMCLASCSQYYYMPNMHQVPLLREKGEARIAFAGSSESFSPWNEAKGRELQVSAAVTDKIGIMMNSATFTSLRSEGQGRLIEVGAGRFAALGEHWTAEAYAGIGRGDVTYSGEETALWRLFAQPSFGYASRNFDFAVTARLCYLDFDVPRITAAYTIRSQEAKAALENEAAHRRVFVEPGFVLRAGTSAVKFQIQYAHSTNLSRPLSMLEDNISVGLQFNINNGFQKRQRVPNK